MVAQDLHHGRRRETATPGRQKLASTTLARGPRGKLFAGLLPTERGGDVYRILPGPPARFSRVVAKTFRCKCEAAADGELVGS